jgi:coproporphyrinogen III oxidase-like Fe-S oxidoreductase
MADEGVTDLATGSFLSPRDRAILEVRLALKLAKNDLTFTEVMMLLREEYGVAKVQTKPLYELIAEYERELMERAQKEGILNG